MKFSSIIRGFLLGAAWLCLSPPASAQYSSGDNTTAAEFEQILKAADRATRDFTSLPPAFSLKKFAPPPLQQGLYGTCVAWSAGYAARSISYAIQRNILHADSIKKYAFSPGYLYYKVKPAHDVNCSAGTSILSAMQEMTSNGLPLKQEGIPDCAGSLAPGLEGNKTAAYKIKDFLALNKTYDSISKNEIIKIKKSIAEKKPVVVSMRTYKSFERVNASGLWLPKPDEPVSGRHAVCIVGYDDKKAGGAFEIMNSWGTLWGNKGFGWLTYAQVMKYGSYMVELMDYEAGNGSLTGTIDFIETDINNREKPMPVVRGKQDDYSQYRLTQTYTAGTRFKMKFSSSSPCYIYVVAQDTKGVLSRLFPPAAGISAAVNSPHATYYFPSDSTHARLDNTVGKELFCIIYSKEAVAFEELLNYIRESGVSLYQGVKDRLGAGLLDMQQIRFRDDRISFSAPAGERSLLCFFVEMNHQ